MIILDRPNMSKLTMKLTVNDERSWPWQQKCDNIIKSNTWRQITMYRKQRRILQFCTCKPSSPKTPPKKNGPSDENCLNSKTHTLLACVSLSHVPDPRDESEFRPTGCCFTGTNAAHMLCKRCRPRRQHAPTHQ